MHAVETPILSLLYETEVPFTVMVAFLQHLTSSDAGVQGLWHNHLKTVLLGIPLRTSCCHQEKVSPGCSQEVSSFCITTAVPILFPLSRHPGHIAIHALDHPTYNQDLSTCDFNMVSLSRKCQRKADVDQIKMSRLQWFHQYHNVNGTLASMSKKSPFLGPIQKSRISTSLTGSTNMQLHNNYNNHDYCMFCIKYLCLKMTYLRQNT